MNRIIIYLVLFFSAYSCIKNEQKPKQADSKIANTFIKPIVTDTVNVSGVVFELIDNNGIAELRIISDSINVEGKIKIAPPCYFVRYENKLRKYEYPAIGVQASIIIIGDTVKVKGNPKTICGKALQGVSMKNNSQVIISKEVIKTNVFCLDSWIDEKDFSGFASGLYDKNK
ncbi:hypothetical protein [Chryseobacterium sp. JK1]|uniref:hypothetical protein n=1 Tax=Chryseobacterium sp. JK1 TaxID=874294 RepID=UPI003D684374